MPTYRYPTTVIQGLGRNRRVGDPGGPVAVDDEHVPLDDVIELRAAEQDPRAVALHTVVEEEHDHAAHRDRDDADDEATA